MEEEEEGEENKNEGIGAGEEVESGAIRAIVNEAYVKNSMNNHKSLMELDSMLAIHIFPR